MSYFCFAGRGDPGLIRYMISNFKKLVVLHDRLQERVSKKVSISL